MNSCTNLIIKRLISFLNSKKYFPLFSVRLKAEAAVKSELLNDKNGCSYKLFPLFILQRRKAKLLVLQ